MERRKIRERREREDKKGSRGEKKKREEMGGGRGEERGHGRKKGV